MSIFNPLFLDKVRRVAARKADAFTGRFLPLQPVLNAMTARPYELHLELTNLCNANCVFCPYQHQTRPVAFMSDAVFEKALADFVALGGGSVGLTPIVGDALIDRKFTARVRRLRSFPQIDRIWVTTNAILLEKRGIEEVLSCGLTSITISTAGFDAESYRRIYRSKQYARMRRAVLALVAANARRPDPIAITIGFRTDRGLDAVLKDPDFQPILAFAPGIDFTWSYTSAGGRITRAELPGGFKLRVVRQRKETCVQLFNGPIVLPDGTVMACSCVAAMDAVADLAIGNVLQEDLGALWRSERMARLRASFGTPQLNRTCATCDMYRDLELYRTSEGRQRAQVSRSRAAGAIVRRAEKPQGAFSGG
jgi:radical SAM protein with 4Fe4S-binding SPASM domain